MAAYYNDNESYYNEESPYSDRVSQQNFSPAGRSEGFFLTFYTETTVQFQVDNIKILE